MHCSHSQLQGVNPCSILPRHCGGSILPWRGSIPVPKLAVLCSNLVLAQAFYILSCWYTRKELALRTAVLYSGLVLATAFSGLIAAGVFSGLDGVRGLAGWRWLFILEAVGSCTASLLALLVLPDYPESKTGSGRWLFTEEDRKFAIERIARDRVSQPEANRSVFYGVKLAAKDYRTWVFVLMLCSNHTAYGEPSTFSSDFI